MKTSNACLYDSYWGLSRCSRGDGNDYKKCRKILTCTTPSIKGKNWKIRSSILLFPRNSKKKLRKLWKTKSYGGNYRWFQTCWARSSKSLIWGDFRNDAVLTQWYPIWCVIWFKFFREGSTRGSLVVRALSKFWMITPITEVFGWENWRYFSINKKTL